MLNYREIKREEIPLCQEMVNYAFNLEKGPFNNQEGEDTDQVIGERRGLFSDSRLLCCYLLYIIKCRLRGHWFNTGGIGDVASPPENRRKGFIREMLKKSLEEMKERDISLSALWPFSYPFYRRLGWEQSSAFKCWAFNPEKIKFAASSSRGDFRKADHNSFRELNKIYQRFYSQYDLEIKRTSDWWEERIFRKNKRYGYIFEEDGQAKGYIIYSATPGKEERFWERTLHVPELIADDFSAYLQLLRFIYYHDSQVKEVRIFAPLDFPVLKFLPDPRIKEHSFEPGVMFRIVDLQKILNSIEYPGEIKGRISLTVRDDLAEWNNGDFILDVEDGRGSCRKQNLKGNTDIYIDVRKLVPILTGFLSPSEAHALGYLKIEDESSLDLLNKILPARKTYFCEFF